MMRDKKDKPWKAEYREKLVSADEAVSHIRSGQRIVFSHAAGESLVLSDALVRNRALLKMWKSSIWLPWEKQNTVSPGWRNIFAITVFFWELLRGRPQKRAGRM